MTPASKTEPDRASEPAAPPAVARGMWWVCGVIAALSLAVLLGGYFLAARFTGSHYGTLFFLITSLLWVAGVSAPLAASSPRAFGSLLRAATVCDSAAVALLVVALHAERGDGTAMITVSAALQIYAVYVAIALLSAAAVCVGRCHAARRAAATAAAVGLLALLASPFWTRGLLLWEARGGPLPGVSIKREVLAWNPFYSATAAVAGRMGFAWHMEGLLYRLGLTPLGDTIAPPPSTWYAAPLRLAGVAVLLGGVAVWRRRRSAAGAFSPAPEAPPAPRRMTARPGRGG